MSYTRHTWTDPETITAAKLNNIEDGIEEAAQSGGGGGGTACVFAHTVNITQTYRIGHFTPAIWDEDESMYVALPGSYSSAFMTYGPLSPATGTNDYVYPSQCPTSLPGGAVLMWVEDNPNVFNYSYTGGVSDTSYWVGPGSIYPGRIVSGNFEMTVTMK